MRIIGYTYESDVHCPACAASRFAQPVPDCGFDLDSYRRRKAHGWIDQHGIADIATDREGNPIHPVFDIDEDVDGSFTHCGDCHEAL